MAWFRAKIYNLRAPVLWWLKHPRTQSKKTLPCTVSSGRTGRAECCWPVYGPMAVWSHSAHGKLLKGKAQRMKFPNNWMLACIYVIKKCEKGYAKWNDVDMILIHYQPFMWTEFVTWFLTSNEQCVFLFPNTDSSSITSTTQWLQWLHGSDSAAAHAARSWKIMAIPRRRSNWSTCWTGKTRLLQTIRNQPTTTVFHVVFRETLRVGSLEIW